MACSIVTWVPKVEVIFFFTRIWVSACPQCCLLIRFLVSLPVPIFWLCRGLNLVTLFAGFIGWKMCAILHIMSPLISADPVFRNMPIFRHCHWAITNSDSGELDSLQMSISQGC